MVDDDTAAAAVVDAQVNEEVDSNGTAIEPSKTTTTPVASDPKPGTPDKALQRMQQDLGTAMRQIAALTERKAEGELNDADRAKLTKAQERITKIRNYANHPDRSEFPSDIDPIAEQLLDVTERVSEVDQLKAALKEANGKIDYLMNDHGWDKARIKYPGLDVDAIFRKAATDATETLGDSIQDLTPAAKQRAVNKLASKWFEERCEAAKKRQGGEVDPKQKGSPAPSSPSSYKVGTSQRVAPVLSEEQQVLAEARALVVET